MRIIPKKTMMSSSNENSFFLKIHLMNAVLKKIEDNENIGKDSTTVAQSIDISQVK